MNELIVIKKETIGNEEVNSVDARELWEFLGSKRQFGDWVKTKVLNNKFFEENQDFTLLHNSVKQVSHGGHNKKVCALTVDTAKKVAMAEQTDKGNEARCYFLECEKIAKGAVKVMTPMEMISEMAQHIVKTEKRQLAIEEKQLATDKKIDALESKMCSNPGYFTVTGYANLMKVSVTTQEANKIGRKAAKLSRESNTAIGKSSHERWGEVNTYHENILQAIFPRK